MRLLPSMTICVGAVFLLLARTPLDLALLRFALEPAEQNVVAVHRPGVNGVNKNNFDRIEIGMTYNEIAAIFGRHRDQECFLPPTWSGSFGTRAMFNFDDKGRVTERFWDEGR